MDQLNYQPLPSDHASIRNRMLQLFDALDILLLQVLPSSPVHHLRLEFNMNFDQLSGLVDRLEYTMLAENDPEMIELRREIEGVYSALENGLSEFRELGNNPALASAAVQRYPPARTASTCTLADSNTPPISNSAPSSSNRTPPSYSDRAPIETRNLSGRQRTVNDLTFEFTHTPSQLVECTRQHHQTVLPYDHASDPFPPFSRGPLNTNEARIVSRWFAHHEARDGPYIPGLGWERSQRIHNAGYHDFLLPNRREFWPTFYDDSGFQQSYSNDDDEDDLRTLAQVGLRLLNDVHDEDNILSDLEALARTMFRRTRRSRR
jgi:hypothetical protein